MKLIHTLNTYTIGLLLVAGSALNVNYALASEQKIELSAQTTHYHKLLGTFATPDGKKHSYDDFLKYFKVPGLSFAVVDDYQLVYSHTAGVKAYGTNDKIDTNTSFSTASISKPVTATIAAMLAEQGKLNLDAPISNYLKRWKMPTSPFTQNAQITMRQLLTHTAGMSQGGYADFHLGDDIPSLLDTLNGKKLPRYKQPIAVMTAPNSHWEYSGGGYVIVQVALEDITGKPLQLLAEEMLFKPLGMNNTTMYQYGDPKFMTNIAKVHDEKLQVIRDGIPICPQIAPSGMWSTAEDMAKFTIAYQHALAGKTDSVISPAVAKETTKVHTLKTVGGWSAGWMRLEAQGNIDWFSHGGSNTGTGGQVMASMEHGKGIMIFINAATPQRNPAINALVKHIVDSLNWTRAHTAKAIVPAKLVNEIKGRYLSPLDQVITIEQQGKELVFTDPMYIGGVKFTGIMQYQGNGKFALDNYANLIGIKQNPQDQQPYLVLYREPEHLSEFAMRKLGDNELLPFEVALKKDIKESLIAYKTWKKQHPNSRFLSANALNNAGYGALAQKNTKAAINFFSVYTTLYSDDANAYDSLGEAYMVDGNKAKSIASYQQSLVLNPKNDNAKKMIETMKNN